MSGKLSPTEVAQLEKELINYCVKFPDGVKQDQITSAITGYELIDIATSINSLINKNRLVLFRHDGICVWKAVAEEKANKLTSLSTQERIVYGAIEKEHNKGIWIKDLRKRTNIVAHGALEKILKSMITRKIIKAHASVAGKNKKVYMLYELKPSLEVTGGTFYKGHEMDTQFISVLRRASMAAIQKTGACTGQQVMKMVQDFKVSAVPFTYRDISIVLNTLVMDRQIEIVSYHNLPTEAERTAYIDRQNKKSDDDDEFDFEDEKPNKRRRLAGMSSVHDESDDDQDEPEVAVAVEDDEEEALNDEDDDIEKVFMIAKTGSYVDPSFTAVPCVGCKLIDKCNPGAIVEPRTCVYFRQWFADEF